MVKVCTCPEQKKGLEIPYSRLTTLSALIPLISLSTTCFFNFKSVIIYEGLLVLVTRSTIQLSSPDAWVSGIDLDMPSTEIYVPSWLLITTSYNKNNKGILSYYVTYITKSY